MCSLAIIAPSDGERKSGLALAIVRGSGGERVIPGSSPEPGGKQACGAGSFLKTAYPGVDAL